MPRVVRVLEYEGDKEWLDRTLERSIKGTCKVSGDNRITEVSCAEVPHELDRKDERGVPREID